MSCDSQAAIEISHFLNILFKILTRLCIKGYD